MTKLGTLGIFAHANAGKTTVTENFLYQASVIDSIGRVDNGNTVTDSLGVERERGITVQASYVTFKLGDKIVQLLDTPGHIDFSAEVERAVSVLDCAILVISGVDGVQPQTLAIWKLLKEKNLPTIIFINKLDRKGASISRTMDDIFRYLGKDVVLVNRYNENTKKIDNIDIKNDLLDVLSRFDDDIINNFLSNNKVEQKDLQSSFIKNFRTGDVTPVTTGSALTSCGIKELMALLNLLMPSHSQQKEDDQFAGYIFSVKNIDNMWYSYVKVIKGEINKKQVIKLGDENIKLSRILVQDGTKQVVTDKIVEGQLAILPGIYIPIGTMIGNYKCEIPKLNYVHPLYNVVLKSEDSEELAKGLGILNMEDPYLNLKYDKITNEFSIDIIGDLQGEIIIRLLRDRFNVNAQIESSSIIYKETPIDVGYGKSGYKRCSNVAIKVMPLERGSGLVFKSEFSTDFLFAKYQKLIENKLMNVYSKYALKGWELTDAQISIVDGKCDNAGSESMHYNIAAPIAFFRALKEAKTKLLEPQMEFDLVCEKNALGEAMLECTKNPRSSVAFEYKNNDMVYIHGIAPLSFTRDLPKRLNKLLAGKFSFVQQEIGYIDTQDEIESRRITPYVSPANEKAFVFAQGGSLLPFDKDLDKKGGKPEHIRRNKSCNKQEYKSNGKPIIKKNDDIEEDRTL